MNKVFFALAIILLLSGCLNNSVRTDDYYEGRDGVDISFADNSPPRELFYRGNPVEFSVDVRVKNEGASLSRGGIYLSGYDPTIFDFEEIEEERGIFDSCWYNIDGIGYGKFQAFVQCKRIKGIDVGISLGDDGAIFDFSKLPLGDWLNDIFDTEWFTDVGFDKGDIRFQWYKGDSAPRLSVEMDNPNFDPQLGSRGPYFLSLWSAINFTRNQGQEFFLRGDIPGFPGGEERFVTFNGVIKDFPDGKDDSRQSVMATSCYLYTTHAAPEMCIDPQPFSDTEKVCRPNDYYSRRGQGAPVAVTSVEQRSTGNEIIFRIEIENIGRGTIFNPEMIEACSPYYPEPLTEEHLNQVVLGMVYMGDMMLDCVAAGEEKNKVRLYDGRGVINCVYDMDSDPLRSSSAYKTPLLVELWYGYSETIQHDIYVQRLIR